MAGGRRFGRACAGSMLLLLLLAGSLAAAQPLPSGRSEATITLPQDRSVTIAAYRPPCPRLGLLIVAFHGSDRNPALVRDNAVPIADAGCALLVAPLMGETVSGRWAYHFGGMADPVDDEGRRRLRLRPLRDRAGAAVEALVAHIREAEGQPALPYVLLGHSAGAQFLSRLAAFHPGDAARYVIANAGSHVWPDHEAEFPYGFRGLPEATGGPVALRRYLGRPVVIIAAERDTKRQGLLKTPAADRQGAHRLERAVNAFEAARRAARAMGEAFGWRLVRVSGLGHGSGRLYAHPDVIRAVLEGVLEPQRDDRTTGRDRPERVNQTVGETYPIGSMDEARANADSVPVSGLFPP